MLNLSRIKDSLIRDKCMWNTIGSNFEKFENCCSYALYFPIDLRFDKKDAATHGLNPTVFEVLELLYYNGDQPIQVTGKRFSFQVEVLAHVDIDKVIELLRRVGNKVVNLEVFLNIYLEFKIC